MTQKLTEMLAPLFKQNLQIDSPNQEVQPTQPMNELLQKLQAQVEPELPADIQLKFDGEPPKRYRVFNENNIWMVENKENGARKTLSIGDWIEFYNGTEAHGVNGEFINTCSGNIIDMSMKHIDIRYRTFKYMMSSGTEIYNYQPIQVYTEVPQQSNNNIIFYVFLIVLAICATITT